MDTSQILVKFHICMTHSHWSGQFSYPFLADFFKTLRKNLNFKTKLARDFKYDTSAKNWTNKMSTKSLRSEQRSSSKLNKRYSQVRTPPKGSIGGSIGGATGRSKIIAPVFKNETCAKLGIFGKGLQLLPELANVTIDLEALVVDKGDDDDQLAYELHCNGVQERPPYEGFNTIHRPFLPCAIVDEEVNSDSLHDPKRLAYVLSRQHNHWQERVNIPQKSLNSK
jgi:hypothetical protein